MTAGIVIIGILLAGGPAAAHPTLWAADLDAGYAFRSQSDGRNHGAAAAASLDIPLIGPLALRPEVLALGFSGPKATNLGLFCGALSVVYAFDDTEAQALASIGPLAGVSVDGAAAPGASLRFGLLAAIGIRFPIADALAIEAKVSLPAVLWGPRGLTVPGVRSYDDGSLVDFPLQTTFQLGVVFDLGALATSFTAPAPAR